MQKVPITQAFPGMVLAKPVMGDKGLPLCAEGTALTEKLIDRLRAMNVPSVTVRGRPLESGAPVKTADQRVREIEERFVRVKGDPLMDKVLDAVVTAVRQEEAENTALENGEGAAS